MKYLLFLPLVLFFYSCSTLKSDAGKSIRNTPDVGIEWEYSGKINDAYQKDMDSVISAEIQKYNTAGHQLHLHKKKAKDKDYLFMEFKEGKLTTKGERAAGYIVTGLGLVATPALLIALNTGFIAIFYYVPENKFLIKCAYSGDLADPSSHGKNFVGSTGALFAKKQKQVAKLYTKFSVKLDGIFLSLEKELSSHQ